MAIFLTGVTGAIGGELLRSILESQADSVVYALFRANSKDEFVSGRTEIQSMVRPEDVSRVIPIAGNVELQDCGLGRSYSEIAEEVSEIYHVAACTNFSQTREQAQVTNVLGTENVIDFALAIQNSGNFTRFHHISTAYVSGTRTGFLREDELEEGQEFFNFYEWSKFEAERAVRRVSMDLPITVYRPGIIIGDSRTGFTSRFQGVYQMMKWIHYGLVDWLPCDPNFRIDLLPVDFVCRTIVQLAALDKSVNKTFHLTAGPDNAISLATLIEAYLRERGAGVRGSDKFKGFRSSQSEGQNAFSDTDLEAISTLFDQYQPYFTCPKVFDNRETRAALPNLVCPQAADFLPGAIRYALNVGFKPAPATVRSSRDLEILRT